MSFDTKYLPKDRAAPRDRFQIEFNQEERMMFNDMQIFLGTHLDATALKQWAFYGWLAKSNPSSAESYFREKLLINERNNARHGRDVKGIVENNFRQKIEKIGWKL